MRRKIRVTISKENTFDVLTLIENIKDAPSRACNLYELREYEGLPYETFSNFDSLSQEAQDKANR